MKRILAFVLLGLLAACATPSGQHGVAPGFECPEVYNGCFSD